MLSSNSSIGQVKSAGGAMAMDLAYNYYRTRNLIHERMLYLLLKGAVADNGGRLRRLFVLRFYCELVFEHLNRDVSN